MVNYFPRLPPPRTFRVSQLLLAFLMPSFDHQIDFNLIRCLNEVNSEVVVEAVVVAIEVAAAGAEIVVEAHNHPRLRDRRRRTSST